MALFKQQFPNGNVFIWLGKGRTWVKDEESNHIDNVLVLSGGEVLFLKTVKILPLYNEEIRKDITTLKHEEFVRKYDLPLSVELWKELKRGTEGREYPAFLKTTEK